MQPGTITLFIATSVDGFIADREGGVAWLEAFEEGAVDDPDDGYEAFVATVDALIMGARTYEQVLGFGDWPYGGKPTYVLTHRDLERATPAVECVEGAVGSLATRLRRDHEHLWLVGGAEVARSFLRAGQVDALRLHLVPIILGDGIPLFASAEPRRGLLLQEATTHRSGIVELRYAVQTDDEP